MYPRLQSHTNLPGYGVSNRNLSDSIGDPKAAIQKQTAMVWLKQESAATVCIGKNRAAYWDKAATEYL